MLPSRVLCRVVLLGAVLVGLLGSAALASPSAKRRATELVEQSMASYRLGQFDEAVRLLEEAYRLYPQPAMLYNLAHALEGKGDKAGAVAAYQRYLHDDPKTDDRALVEGHVLLLESQLAHEEEARKQAATQAARAEQEQAAAAAEAERARDAAQAQAQALAAQHDAEVEQRTRRHAKQRTIAAWSLLGVGAAALITGGVLGGEALAKRDYAESGTGLFASQEYPTAQHLALGANVCFGLGGVLAGAGLVWGLVETLRARRHAERHVALVTP